MKDEGRGPHQRGAHIAQKRSANSARQNAAPSGGATNWPDNGWLTKRRAFEVYYADGHVRLYHCNLTALPRVTTHYWVNAMDGRPVFRRQPAS
jgi:hypothetical protein